MTTLHFRFPSLRAILESGLGRIDEDQGELSIDLLQLLGRKICSVKTATRKTTSNMSADKRRLMIWLCDQGMLPSPWLLPVTSINNPINCDPRWEIRRLWLANPSGYESPGLPYDGAINSYPNREERSLEWRTRQDHGLSGGLLYMEWISDATWHTLKIRDTTSTIDCVIGGTFVYVTVVERRRSGGDIVTSCVEVTSISVFRSSSVIFGLSSLMFLLFRFCVTVLNMRQILWEGLNRHFWSWVAGWCSGPGQCYKCPSFCVVHFVTFTMDCLGRRSAFRSSDVWLW